MSEEKQVVAFLGPSASYTHQATLSEFPDTKYSLDPQIQIKDVFFAVQNGSAPYGVVPVENSTNGSVVPTLDLLVDLHGQFPDILVVGEIYFPIHHCLLGHIDTSSSNQSPRNNDETGTHLAAASPSPTHSLTHLKKLYTHLQAWDQCSRFLSTPALARLERQDASSTSKAAEIAASDPSRTSAAISSVLAAKNTGLDILAQNIEDDGANSTKFLVLRRKETSPQTKKTAGDADAAGKPDVETEEAEGERYKTLISFKTSHSSPGALADSLAVFKAHGLNLTSINSRPSRELAWHYIFLVEIKGRKRADGQGGAVNEALAELGRLAKGWRWLGSWENRLKG